MNSRERIDTTCSFKEPDILPVDFGGGFQTGIAVSMVYMLRQALNLDQRPGTPVKVVEPYQMLGEIKPDLQEVLGIDVVSLSGTGTMFGFPNTGWKEWKTPDGIPVLVPGLFNTQKNENNDIFQYPEGDKTLEPSSKMPDGGFFFDAIIRQNPIDDNNLNINDNLEEYGLINEAEIEHYKETAEFLYNNSNKALFCSFGGLTFGDVALIPGISLKNPKGIRDIEEWYISTMTRKDYIKAFFEKQSEIAIENLKRLKNAVGDKISIIQTNGTDLGTQNGPFLSQDNYCELYKPFQKKIHDWIHDNTGWKTFMHCCGGIEPLIEDFIEAGFDILNPVQVSAAGMDAKKLKEKYNKRIVFWGGGVDTQKTLPFGKPQEVKDEVKERIDIFSKDGGYVFNSIHNIVANIPIENILAMFEVLKEYRKMN